MPSDVAELRALVARLLEENAQLKRMLFGRRSEKPADDPNQQQLFGSAPAEAPPPDDDDDDPKPPPPRRKGHRGRRPLPEHLPRQIHEIHPPADEQSCPDCGQAKVVFGQDVTEELEVIPARFFVNRCVRFKYACRHCQGQVSVGPLPPRPLHKGVPGAGFLAIDNNHSERQIKQLVIGRKNWMFAGSGAGAENAALLFSLVVSCKLAGVDPFAYFRDVLLRIHSHPAERIAELIPREWKTRFAPAALAPTPSAA